MSSIKANQQSEPSVYRYDEEAIKNRPIKHSIHPLIASRRSLRGLSGEPIEDEVLFSLFEAARWSPSRFNAQSWRFVYAKRDNTPNWDQFVDAVNENNRPWAQYASVLLVVLSKTTVMKRGQLVKAPSHTFDTGAAWMAMALEGTARGLVVHAIGGFYPDRAAKAIKLADNQEEYQIECMIAIGQRDDSRKQPDDCHMRLFTPRIEIEAFISEGEFKD